MEGLRSSFFLDHEVIMQVGKRTVEETKAHLVFLNNNGTDRALSVAVLSDGNAIDFLFGVKNTDARSVASKANSAKKFMRSLDEQGQESVARFYLVVYQSLANYHRKLENPCSCLWSYYLRKDLQEQVEDAFQCLRVIVTDRNIRQDD